MLLLAKWEKAVVDILIPKKINPKLYIRFPKTSFFIQQRQKPTKIKANE